MHFKHRPKAVILLSCICVFAHLHVLAQGCVDTIISKQFNVENFGGADWSAAYQDDYDNFYVMGSIRPVNPLSLKSSLVKFNNQKKLVWSKAYNASTSFDVYAFFRRMAGVDNEQKLYYLGTGAGVNKIVNLLKLDSNGNILDNKILQVTNSPGNSLFNAIANTGKIFSTITCSYYNGTGKDAHFVAIAKDFNAIRWSKTYKPAFLNFIIISGNTSLEVNDTTSLIATALNYKNRLNPNDTIYTFHFLKINSLTGNIIQQKSYIASEQENPGKSFHAFPFIKNVNYANQEITYQIRKNSVAGDIYSFFTIDSNLNIINSANYLCNTAFNAVNYNSISKNEIIVSGNITQNAVTKLATISWNRNLQLINQKTYYSSQFVSSNYSTMAYKNTNNTFSYFVPSFNSVSPVSNPIYFFDNIKNPNFEFDCSDKDAQIFQPADAFIFTPDTSTFISQPGYNYQLFDNPVTYSVQNNNFSEEKYCDLVSICTSLKIQGKSSFCLNNGNIDSFKVVRNNACKRKTIFTVDNSQVQVLQSNDSLIKVKFLKPFKGYIKATYENCTVVDSFYIEVDTVYNIKTGVYLGKDTLQCPGKQITLYAGNGFKKYQWQDGSTLSTYTTSDAGLFYIKVTDSCNNVFKDSIQIFGNTKKLNIGYSGTLCEYDTAIIILPAGFTNYNWQPLSSGIQSGNKLLLFSTGTTIYTINAQSHTNCFIEDTVLIKKKDCYGSLYFPTAFSPNNDGINDNYKPKAVGILQSYSFTIYNRYGNIVFHTNEINEGWNGRYKNKIQTGGYTWVCIYTFRSRKSETESGSFVLLQ